MVAVGKTMTGQSREVRKMKGKAGEGKGGMKEMNKGMKEGKKE